MKIITDHPNAFSHKRVIVRCNFDVPIENKQVTDTTRIEDAVATIKFLLDQSASVILAAHAGRPEGTYQAHDSLSPIVPVMQQLLNQPVHFVPYSDTPHPFHMLPNAPLILLDNLRFWPGEEANDPTFAKELASIADVYVNESFATCHRKHASIVGIADVLPSYAGISLAQEISVLDQVLTQPKHPLVLVMGGAKLETKQPLITKFTSIADQILIGGKLAVELKEHPQSVSENIIVAELVESGFDITQASAHQFASIILKAGTVIWNGTMGKFEEADYLKGTQIVANAINSTSAFTLVGGGDTETALTLLDAEANIDHISSGGGAMLQYLVDQQLPGLSVLQ